MTRLEHFRKCMTILDRMTNNFQTRDFEELDFIEQISAHINFLFNMSDFNRADYSLTSEHFGAKYANFRHAMQIIQYMLDKSDDFNLNEVRMLSYNIQQYVD